jgi:hypothetical protein
LVKIFAIIVFGITFCLANSQDTTDTTGKKMNPDSLQNPIKIPSTYLHAKNPITSGAFSALIPGAGQIYTGNYIKSGLFFTSEAIMGLVAYNRFLWRDDFRKNSKVMYDSMMQYKDVIDTVTRTVKNKANTPDSVYKDTIFKSLGFKMNYDYNQFLERENRYFIYQTIVWMSGLYYWNILDAIQNTKFFMNDDPKIPSKAGWLAAIPALGLGQLYNGELWKAGMVFMVQTNLAYMVYNNNKLMQICEDNLRIISSPFTREGKDKAAEQLKISWDSKRSDAFRKRNMWAWYSIAFYFYSIFDAIVDAHLHDSAKKMKLEPDLLTGEKGIGLHFTMTF